MPDYQLSIGLEVHAELLTESKMFCRCPVGFLGEPNSRTCPVCLGLPGALPVPNRSAIEMVLKTALALNCKIPNRSVFHRKNYFYPDLPKGFQVSQYEETNPIGYHGWLDIPLPGGTTKRIHIRRVHLEEDTGKLVHLGSEGSGVDYNRAGVPLMEIVTEFPPDAQTAEEARLYLTHLRDLLIWIGVCDGKMEEGSLRCEPNISIRPVGTSEYGTKTEIKNLNSFKSVYQGIEFELKRQSDILDRGEKVQQETLGWNEKTLSTYVMRTKESEADYRYFTCPDLAPMTFSDTLISEIRDQLPELPMARRARYVEKLSLSEYDAEVLTQSKDWSDFFERAIGSGSDPKTVCNILNGDFTKLKNGLGEDAIVPDAKEIGQLADMIHKEEISSKSGKIVLEEMFKTGRPAVEIVEARGLKQVSDSGAVAKEVALAIEAHPEAVQQFREGKENVIGFLVGAVMKATQGRVKPSLVQEEMERQLRKDVE